MGFKKGEADKMTEYDYYYLTILKNKEEKIKEYILDTKK